MSLIACPECGTQVSDKATACPKCGCPVSAAVPLQLPTPPPFPPAYLPPTLAAASAPPRKGTPGLAVAALVLACLFFLPFVPLVGTILGIIAVIVAKPNQSRTAAIVAICVGIVVAPVSLIMSAVTIPSFIKYNRRSKTTEASMNIRKLYDSTVSYYEAEHADYSGTILPPQFPVETAWTPAETPCNYPEQKFPVQPTLWAEPTWQALNFSVDDSSYYQYRVRRDGNGSNVGDQFFLEARGDLNCNGVWSLYRRTATVDQNHNINGGSGLYIMNDIE